MSTQALKKSIIAAINNAVSVHAPCSIYYGQAPAEHSKRYIVVVVEELTFDDYRTGCELEVNCIDYGNDTSTCEAMADKIQKYLDKKFYSDSDIAWECYREKRNPVSQEDKQIIWRRLTFTLNYYERG